MKILVINAGSSSLKYQLINMETGEVMAKGNCERIGIDGRIGHKTASGYSTTEECSFPTHTEAFEKVVELLTTGENKVVGSISEIAAVGHRVVHGGEIFSQSVLLTDENIEKIDALSPLAPLHNPAAILAIRACQKVFGKDTPMVAVFDTAFHQTMPAKAYMYGLPYEDYEQYSIRKYGFHGTSHRFVSADFAKRIGKPIEDLKIVTCHLGNGSSITAVDGGKSVDTTMGFTPLDGVLMGTRSGNIDASAVLYLMEKTGMTTGQMSDYLNKKSGFLGLSGRSSDNRDVEAGAAEGDARCQLTGDMLAYQIKKQIGAYAAAMGGLDAVVFTGGIGENASNVRAGACAGLDRPLGLKLDAELNEKLNHGEGRISTPDSKVEVWIVPTNEELLIAMDTAAIVSGK
jgi:acetate kinase